MTAVWSSPNAAGVHSKRDSAKLAQEQSTHLFLCVMIGDLTQRYGTVVRPAKVVGVLDAAFDVYVPEFGIEKRVHIDQMPIDVRAHNAPPLACADGSAESRVRRAHERAQHLLVG
jgi:exoribonuclease R